MKGYFSINYDWYTDKLHFGNLDPDMNSLGHLKDACSEHSTIGRLIAHDVVEHSLAHRTKKHVSWEDEYASGISIFFDTVKHIFRWQFKRSV